MHRRLNVQASRLADILCHREQRHVSQQLSHTAIIENKRLSHALATVKAQQDLKHGPKIQTNSDKGGYKKNPRRVYGPDYSPKVAAVPAVEMTA